MKKKCINGLILAAMCTVLVGNVAYGASTSASVSIKKSDYSKKSSAVGIAKSATYTASNNYTSGQDMTMNAYACWTGWPYTLESSTNVAPEGKYTYVEKQDKNSNFYIELIGYNSCIGSGRVTTN